MDSPDKSSSSSRREQILLLANIIIFTAIVFGGFFLYGNYTLKLLPTTFINEVNLGGLTLEEALITSNQLSIASQSMLTLQAGEFSLASSSQQLNIFPDIQGTVKLAFKKQRERGFWIYLYQLLSEEKITYQPQWHYNEAKLSEFIHTLAQAYNQSGRTAQISVGTKQEPIIDPGKNAQLIDELATKINIQTNFPRQTVFTANTINLFQTLSDEQIQTITTQATTLLPKKLTLVTDLIDNFQFAIKGSQLLPLLLPTEASRQATLDNLYQEVAPLATRLPQEPQLSIAQNQQQRLVVNNFLPPQNGLTLEKNQFFTAINQALPALLSSEDKKLSITLPLQVTAPQHSLEQTNNLGIKEVIGFGESYYAHSIAGRVHNVAHTADKINDFLIAPGEEFSFNRALGEVSAATGFKPGYVIKEGRSVLADGGGVCQVSTTLFRALLDAGLNITLRKAHSYRVAYYELNNQPGFDATVYAGNVDLRFINDTNHYILIHHQVDSQALYMTTRIYGTSDGRYSKISDYQKFGAKSAPPPEYIPDPSLPAGVKKQIDWATAGLQTSFVHTIYNANGSVRSQHTYRSNYIPWSSKFLVGTGN